MVDPGANFLPEPIRRFLFKMTCTDYEKRDRRYPDAFFRNINLKWEKEKNGTRYDKNATLAKLAVIVCGLRAIRISRKALAKWFFPVQSDSRAKNFSGHPSDRKEGTANAPFTGKQNNRFIRKAITIVQIISPV